MLEQSERALADAPAHEKALAEAIALRYLASELEENLVAADEAASTAQARKDDGDEIWMRTVYGVLLGLRSAEIRGYCFPRA